MAAHRESVGLNKGAKGSVVTGAGRTPVKELGGSQPDPPKQDFRPTLAEAGIDKRLAEEVVPPAGQVDLTADPCATAADRSRRPNLASGPGQTSP